MKLFARAVLALLLASSVWKVAAAPSALTVWDESGAPFSAGIKVAPDSALYFSAGMTAGRDAKGDLKEQALVTLKKLTDSIGAAGFTLADVVHVRAYLVPAADGTVDYAGWNAAWNETFNHPGLPHKPTRTSLAVPRLGGPTTLIEIEFVCAASPRAELFAGANPSANPMLRPYGNAESRIHAGMGVVPGAGLYWTAGIVPGKDAGPDTRSQARHTLNKLKANLTAAGLSFQDVVFLRCFVAPDPAKGNTFDLEGWNAAYDEFFKTAENPHKPARTTVTAPTISGDNLLEIELIVAKPAGTVSPTGELRTFGEESAVISSGIGLPAGAAFYFSSGTAGIVGKDVQSQAFMALTTLKMQLAKAGMTFKDVVFLRAYLVPEADGSIDRKGWSDAYHSFFNSTANPHKPARTTIPVHSLPSPKMKIEIDIIAAKR